uniref:Reverse transcriptase domain-containing protein n=1 Tax=Oryzias melastigma TaxID=30732 RepID=A0A3B3CX90_ORYME
MLDPNKSSGLDELDPFFFKIAAPVIAGPITNIFNLSLQTAEIPQAWKSALVRPLFKGGDRSDPNCYRPISILPCLAKVLERIVNNQLTHYLKSHNILSPVQSGFRSGYGCTTASLKVLNDITSALDSKLKCSAIFIDLAKAFDSVNHSCLIERLCDVGVSENSLLWFSNYLSERKQCVKSEQFLSHPLHVTTGVPQGSIIGPTLFSIYINNIGDSAGDSLIHLYADDTVLYSVGPSLDIVKKQLQHSFNKIQLSFSRLHLKLNVTKTKIMWFGKKGHLPSPPPSITTLDGTPLEQVTNYKYLGIWLDDTLSFSTHIHHLQSKVKSKIGALYRMRSSLTFSARRTLVQTTILPILDYGDVIYRSASKHLLQKLDPLYHSAIRFITNAPFKTHHCTLYSSVNWTSLFTRRKCHWLLLIYKTLLGLSPPYLRQLLHTSSPVYNTRTSKLLLLKVPKLSSSLGSGSFQYAAARDWNDLQKTLRLDTFISLADFKKYLNEYFKDECFCSSLQ